MSSRVLTKEVPPPVVDFPDTSLYSVIAGLGVASTGVIENTVVLRFKVPFKNASLAPTNMKAIC